MDPKTIRTLLLVWLICISVGTAITLFQAGALTIFSFFLIAEASQDIVMPNNSSTFIILVVIFLVICVALILPLVLAWKSWKNEGYKRALTLSLITLGLILLPRLFFLF